MSHNYRSWRDFFNDRQLLALGLLQRAIFELNDVRTRDALLLLFSGVLEFNNLFVSYKGADPYPQPGLLDTGGV
jgi:putative DNA methylase